MKLGTIVYDNKIYNLDYMSAEEVKEILISVELEKNKNITKGKKVFESNS